MPNENPIENQREVFDENEAGIAQKLKGGNGKENAETSEKLQRAEQLLGELFVDGIRKCQA